MISKRQIARSLNRLSRFVAEDILDHKLLSKRLEWAEGKIHEGLPQQIKRSRQLTLFNRKDSEMQHQTYELEEDIE